MFDIYLGDLELTTLVLILSFAVIIPVQIFLCFQVKSRVVRLFPASVFAVLSAILVLMSTMASGWDGLGYIMLAILTMLMLFACGVGWGVWRILILLKKRKGKSIL